MKAKTDLGRAMADHKWHLEGALLSSRHEDAYSIEGVKHHLQSSKHILIGAVSSALYLDIGPFSEKKAEVLHRLNHNRLLSMAKSIQGARLP